MMLMPDKPKFVREEPALTAGTALSVVSALLVLLRAYGVAITEDQYNAILSFVGIAGPLVALWWVRRNVTPTEG